MVETKIQMMHFKNVFLFGSSPLHFHRCHLVVTLCFHF